MSQVPERVRERKRGKFFGIADTVSE